MINGTAKHKYAITGFIYLLGLICASFMEITALIAVFVILVAACMLCLRKRRHISFYTAVIAVSFIVMGLYRLAVIEPCYKLAEKTVTISGTVTETLSPDNDTVMLSVSGMAEGTAVKFTLFTADKGITVGDTVELTAAFHRLKDTGYFAEESYYYSKGIFLKAYARGDIAVTEGTVNLVSRITGLSRYFRERTGVLLNDGSAGLVNAMLFGDKSGLSTELKTCITRSGVSHLTAVSGMHLSLLVCLFVSAANAVFKGRKSFTAIAVVLFTCFLMVFFGLTASVLRSGFMMIISHCSFFFRRKSNTLDSVGGALLLILLAEPCACRDVGLCLSVLGTLGVGVMSPAVCRRLGHDNYIIKALSASVCAAVCTAPVGMLCFGGISTVAMITSVVLQPFFTVVIALTPAAVIFPFLSGALLFASGCSAKIMDYIITLLGNLTYSYIEVDEETIIPCIAIIAVFSAVLFITGKQKRVPLLVLLSAVSFCGGLAVSSILKSDNISIVVYSDGTNAVTEVKDGKGISLYTHEYNDRTADMIYECTVGESVELICISEKISDNILPDYDCTVHTPENGSMCYDISGEYSVIVHRGEIILEIRGLTVGILTTDSKTLCDAAIYTGYTKNFSGGGNSATILCDKRFYNWNNNVNACYERAEFIINPEGMLALG